MSLIVLIRDRRHSFCGNLKEMRFAGSTKLRTVSFHVLLFYDPMYNRSKFCHLSISQFLSQSLHNLLHLQYCSYLSTLFRKYTPLASIGAYLVHHKSIVLIFIETNAIKYLLHPAFMTRNINAFTHVLDIPARLFPICRLFPVTINDNHYLFLSVT